MRNYLFCLALLAAGTVYADELADANQLLVSKSYPQALQLFSKLASAGNAEAQLRLGEMHWYGEGVPLDRAKGDALFAQAAASGNQEARAALGMSGQRESRRADIAYWTGKYNGADLKAGKYDCVQPVIPAVSKQNDEINAVAASLNAWTACYNGFVGNVGDAMPAGKRIPPEIAVLMSEQEVEQAKLHLDRVYAAVIADVTASANALIARRDAWEKATVAYVSEQNNLSEARTMQAKLDIENTFRMQNQFANGLMRSKPVPGGK
jgi:hypothetical protein